MLQTEEGEKHKTTKLGRQVLKNRQRKVWPEKEKYSLNGTVGRSMKYHYSCSGVDHTMVMIHCNGSDNDADDNDNGHDNDDDDDK